MRGMQVAVAELPFAIVSTKLTAGGLGGEPGVGWGLGGEAVAMFIKTLARSWEFMGMCVKTLGKPWENHRKTIGKWWFHGMFMRNPLW